MKFGIVVVLLCVVVVGLYVGGHVLFFRARYIGGGMISFTYIFYIIFCVGTYTKILFILINSRRNIQHNPAERNESALKFVWMTVRQQGYVVPVFITLTYLVLVVIPFIVHCTYCFLHNDCFGVPLMVVNVTVVVNNISDALIYIFGDKHIRSYLRDKYRRNQQVDDNRNNNNIEMREI